MKRFAGLALTVLVSAISVLNVNAQTAASLVAPQPAPAQVTAPQLKLGDVTVTGSVRARGYAWSWFKPLAGNNEYQYSGNILRINLAANPHGTELDAEFAVPFMLDLPLGATGTGANQGALGFGSNYFSANTNRQNVAMIFPRQLYAKFSLAGDKGNTLKVGRFTFLDGSEIAPKNATVATLKRDRISQRLIGDFGFSDVGRSFDGAQYSYSPSASNNLTVIAAVPTRGVFQVDGWGWNRIAFGYAAYTHEWGSGHHSADTRVFAIEYDDWRHILKTDNRPTAVRKADTANIVVNSFGGHSIHAFDTGAGTFNAIIWGVGQTGRWGRQKQRAGAVDAEAGFQPKIKSIKPWIRGGYTWGSGSDTTTGDTHGTFFQILPTPRPYARMPFYNMENSEDIFGALILRPHAKLTTSSEFHSLRLADANDFWYSGGGAYQPWSFGYTGRATTGRRSLGNLYDTNIEYRVHPKATFTAYYGYMQGLAVMHQIYPAGKIARFGYVEALYRF
jgi:hypothetical protein